MKHDTTWQWTKRQDPCPFCCFAWIWEQIKRRVQGDPGQVPPLSWESQSQLFVPSLESRCWPGSVSFLSQLHSFFSLKSGFLGVPPLLPHGLYVAFSFWSSKLTGEFFRKWTPFVSGRRPPVVYLAAVRITGSWCSFIGKWLYERNVKSQMTLWKKRLYR